jgi:hypothetical protein
MLRMFLRRRKQGGRSDRGEMASHCQRQRRNEAGCAQCPDYDWRGCGFSGKKLWGQAISGLQK